MALSGEVIAAAAFPKGLDVTEGTGGRPGGPAFCACCHDFKRKSLCIWYSSPAPARNPLFRNEERPAETEDITLPMLRLTCSIGLTPDGSAAWEMRSTKFSASMALLITNSTGFSMASAALSAVL